MGRKFHSSLPAFKALADNTRLEILGMISYGELCACEILESLKITQATLSYHMKILTDSSVVHSRREGKKILYTINRDQLEMVQLFIQSLIKTAEENRLPQREAK